MARNNCKILVGSMEQLSITFNNIISSIDKQRNPINHGEFTRFHLRIRLRNLYMSYSEKEYRSYHRLSIGQEWQLYGFPSILMKLILENALKPQLSSPLHWIGMTIVWTSFNFMKLILENALNFQIFNTFDCRTF